MPARGDLELDFEDAAGLRWFLDHGVDVNANRCLHHAISRGRRLAVITMLLEAGADTASRVIVVRDDTQTDTVTEPETETVTEEQTHTVTEQQTVAQERTAPQGDDDLTLSASARSSRSSRADDFAPARRSQLTCQTRSPRRCRRPDGPLRAPAGW